MVYKAEGDQRCYTKGKSPSVICTFLIMLDRWLRLKGCGDLTNGFPLANVDDHPGLIQIRGCMFEHTCNRELFMTSLINDVLYKNGLVPANIPVGWWTYELPDAPMPLITNCCAIYETVGYTRLSDHVLVGLERLLPYPNITLSELV